MRKSLHKNRQSRPFSLLVKPAGADCNLRCTYCFYLDKCKLYPDSSKHRMQPEVLERMVSSFMGTRQQVYSFGWQGGEPTLMGLDFFKNVVRLQKEYGKPGASVANGLQTNTTLIDDDFAKFLAEYRFLLGVSLDGPESIHNKYRLDAGGKGSYHRVMRGIELLKKHEVEFNILILVSESNVNHAKEVYNFLKEQGFYYQQYIPCVEFDEQGNLLPFSITGEQWGNFLTDIFDEWYPEDTRKISIRHFDSFLEFLLFRRYNVCAMGGACNNYFVVEHNGDIYPCDFFVEKDLKLGNIMTGEWAAFQASPVYRKFAAAKSSWNEECTTCPYLAYCSGDCPKHRYRIDKNPRRMSALCKGWKQFYSHSEETFIQLAATLRREQKAVRSQNGAQGIPDSIPEAKAEDTCFCGSGKKYKNCHGAALLRIK